MISRGEPALRLPRAWTERCADRSGGFTLIELLAVLAILGLALALISGYKPPWSRGLGIEATAAALAARVPLCRPEAMAANPPTALYSVLVAHRYGIAAAPPRRLPADLSIELLT